MRRRLAILGVPCAVVISALQACSAFSAEEAPSDPIPAEAGSPDALADATADVSTRVDAPPVPMPITSCAAVYDAGVDGGAVVFCDDFENKGTPSQGWASSQVSDGNVELSTMQKTSGTTSLRVTIAAPAASGSAKMAYLVSQELSAGGTAGFPLFVEFELFAEMIPPYEGLPEKGFTFALYRSGTGDLKATAGVSEADKINPFLKNGEQAALMDIGTWHHVVYRIDAQRTLDVTPRAGGTALHRMELDTLPAGAEQRLSIGAETPANGGPLTIYIDDVVIHR
jgi:hypothetical protein